MPVLTKTRDDGSRRYYVVTKHEGKRQSHGGYATKREATRALNALKHAKDVDTYKAPSGETLADFLAGWLERKAETGEHSTRTSVFYRDVISAYVVPVCGSVKLTDLKPKHVQDCVRAMSKGRRMKAAPASVQRRYRVLKAALADAVKTDRLTVSACRGIDLPKITSATLTPPTPEQVATILTAAVEPYVLPLTLAAWTGLRRGEVLGLRWSDVDLDAGVLRVEQAASYVDRNVIFKAPKSDGSRRAVPLAPPVVAILREHKREQAARRLKLEAWRDFGLVVDNGDGSPMHPERLSRYYREHVADLGIPTRLHDLRHAAITVQLAAGVPMAVVSAVAGHADTAFTVRQYGHLQPEHLREAADAMARAYA